MHMAAEPITQIAFPGPKSRFVPHKSATTKLVGSFHSTSVPYDTARKTSEQRTFGQHSGIDTPHFPLLLEVSRAGQGDHSNCHSLVLVQSLFSRQHHVIIFFRLSHGGGGGFKTFQWERVLCTGYPRDGITFKTGDKAQQLHFDGNRGEHQHYVAFYHSLTVFYQVYW